MRGQGHSIRFCLRLPAVVGDHLPFALKPLEHATFSPSLWTWVGYTRDTRSP
jgi:hypothetical protein